MTLTRIRVVFLCAVLILAAATSALVFAAPAQAAPGDVTQTCAQVLPANHSAVATVLGLLGIVTDPNAMAGELLRGCALRWHRGVRPSLRRWSRRGARASWRLLTAGGAPPYREHLLASPLTWIRHVDSWHAGSNSSAEGTRSGQGGRATANDVVAVIGLPGNHPRRP
ncbi:MAG: hypothetical protein M3548_17655 [Actinomycetota bacterium]|nr:hypothetical protein [Actinomycetota bacterium]